MKLYIFTTLLIVILFPLIAYGQLNYLSITPQEYNIKEQYQIGQCSITIDTDTFCKTGNCSMSIVGMFQLASNDYNIGYIQTFNIYNLVSSTGTLLTYQFDIFPHGVSGGLGNVSFTFYVNGYDNVTISTDDIAVMGYTYQLNIITSDVEPQITLLQFPSANIDPSTGIPMIFTIETVFDRIIDSLTIGYHLNDAADPGPRSILFDRNTLIYHANKQSIFQTSLLPDNIEGNYTIDSVELFSGSNMYKKYDTLDLLSLGLPTQFSVVPSHIYAPRQFPTISSLFISENNITLSWDQNHEIFVEIDLGGGSDIPLIGVGVAFNGIPNHYEFFDIPRRNPIVSFNTRIDTTSLTLYECNISIINFQGEAINYPCGQINIVNPYPLDTTPPVVINYQLVGTGYPFQLLLTVQDPDSGVSLISNEMEYGGVKVYDNQRLNGTIYSCTFLLELNYFTEVNLTIYDFAHNSIILSIPLPVDGSSIVNNDYLPMLFFKNPKVLSLNNAQLQEIFFNFIDPQCLGSSTILKQMSLFYTEMDPLYNQWNIISGNECNAVIGDVSLIPQYKRVGILRTLFIAFSPYGVNSVAYPVETTIINPYLGYLEYSPIVVGNFRVNQSSAGLSSGDDVYIEAMVQSNLRVDSVQLLITRSEQENFVVVLQNTFGTVYNGNWSTTWKVPNYLNNGIWTIELSVLTTDNDDSLVLPWNFLFSKSFSAWLNVTGSIIDETPPAIYDLVNQWSVDRSITIRARDLESGVSTVKLILTPNNITSHSNPGSLNNMECDINNYPQNLDYVDIGCTFLPPAYYFTGRYYIYVNVTDYAGNSIVYSPQQLNLLVLPSYIDISTSNNGGDTVAPIPIAYTISQPTITTYPTTVTVTVTITDNNSGVLSFDLTLNSTLKYMKQSLTSANRVSGTALNGVYSTQFIITNDISNGTIFSISIQNLIDNAGNSQNYLNTFIGGLSGGPPSGNSIQLLNSLGDTQEPKLMSIQLGSSVIDQANMPTPPLTIQVTINDNNPLMFTPVVSLQHTTKPISQIQCTYLSGPVVSGGVNYTYQLQCITAVGMQQGVYAVHVRSFADRNGNYNSCFNCQFVKVINSRLPRIISYQTVPTRGGRVIFQVENFVNLTTTKIYIGSTPCQNQLWESPVLDQISCQFSNGTGSIADVRGYSNGWYTNYLLFHYAIPSVQTTTSVLPSGGYIVIGGDNFGNSTDKISIYIGNINCVPYTVSDTEITCNLLPGGNGIQKNVYITVNGLKSLDGIGKFSYGDPPNTPCPLSNCSGNGVCISGTCYCQPPWTGEICDQQIIYVGGDGDGNAPTIVIRPNSTSEDIATIMAISIVSFNELNISGSTIKVNKFNSWLYRKYSTPQADNFQYTTNFSSVANIKVLMQVFKQATNITFAGQTTLIPQYGIKYSINITNYPFNSPLNNGQLIMASSLITNSQDNTFCGNFNQTQIGDGLGGSSDVRWIKITQGGYSLYGRFSNRAVIDSRAQIITNNIAGGVNSIGDSSTSTSFIAISFPHFYKQVQIDPDFSIILDPESKSDGSDNLCEKKSTGRKWLIPMVIVLAAIAAVGLGVGTFLYIKRYQREKLFNTLLQKHSNSGGRT